MRPPESWKTARVTLVLTLVAAAVFLVSYPPRVHDALVDWAAFVPAEVDSGLESAGVPFWLTPLTSAFLHANFVHIAFNLLIFVFCGRPTEAVLGPGGMVVLFLTGAYAAAAGQYLVDPNSLTPMIGASGAVSAVLGAYGLLFGRNKVKVANPTLALWLHALWLFAAWVIMNVIVGIVMGSAGIMIAVAAHIGGFVIGLALARPLLLFRYRKA